MNPASAWTSRTFTKSPDFVQREVAGEFLLVPIRRRLSEVNRIYVLNETAAALWHRLDGRRSAREIMDDFIQEFDVGAPQLERDFQALLDDLLGIRAIEESPSQT
jgi:hypothetical protein